MPIEIPKRLAQNIDRFSGRAWLLQKILEWWDLGDERMFLLTGNPGTGKSMIVAWLAGSGTLPQDPTAGAQLVRVRSLVKAVHFCQADTRNISPHAFAESIANQLATYQTGFSEALAETLSDLVQITATQTIGAVAPGGVATNVSIRLDLGALGDELSFDRAFTQPLKKLYDSGYSEPMLLLVDALDEALGYTGEKNLLALLATIGDLPQQVRILITTRDDPRVVDYYNVTPFDLIKDVPPDRDDVRDYGLQRLTSLNAIQESKVIEFADRLSKQAGGIFLYAAVVLDELFQATAELPDLDTYPLPRGLGGLYCDFLKRELGTEDKGRRWHQMYKPLLGFIAVAQAEGLTSTQLTALVKQDIAEPLDACKQYLSGTLPDGPFRLFHKSFSDFLLEDKTNIRYHIDGQKMHQQIADHYWSKGNECQLDDYALEYSIVHLLAAGYTDEAADQLLNPSFLESKAEARLIYDLPRELEQSANRLERQNPKRRMLLLLREAIQNSVSFVAEHPESLFACLWNQCWWYDSREAAYHYVEPDGARPKEGPPWMSSVTSLSTTMESWRAWKEQRSPGFRWIRSLRPPLMCLGTALLAVLRGGGSGTRNISVSTDNRIASSSFDGICIWDLDTGKQLVRFPGGDYISQWVKFTPYAVHVISGGVYSTVRIWNSHTGAQVAELGDKGAGRVESVAVSKDGRKVITGSSDETVRVWDLSSGREIRRLLGHKGTINALDISPDATKIASVGDDGTVRVWDAETGIELRCFKSDYLIYHGWGWKVFLNTVRFSPDSRQIVSGGNDKSIRLWDVELGVPVATFGTDGNNIESVIFTPDGRKVVAGHYDGTIRVWTLTGEQVACHEGHEGGVLCVEVTADGQRIVSVDEHDTIRVWSIEGSSSIPRLHNHNSGVQVMRFSPDGKWLVSGSWDGTLLLWNAENGRPVGILGGEQIKESGVTGLGFSSSGQHLISCGEDGVIRVWDLETRRELRQIRGPRSQLRCVAVSPDERRIAAGTDNGKIWMWEFDTGKKLVRKNCCNNGWVASIAFSHDSKYLASGELEKIKIWDARKGELLRSFGTPGDSEEMIDDIEFMQDGQRLIARGSVVRIWDTKRGVSLKNLGKVGDIGALARGSKRFPFVVRETKHSMVVEDAETYKPIVWYPETPWISKLRTHPSGHIWASAKSTNHVYIFTLEGDRNA